MYRFASIFIVVFFARQISAPAQNIPQSLSDTSIYHDDIVSHYANAQRLLYTPLLRPNNRDTLNHSYFRAVDTAYGDVISVSRKKYWHVPCSPTHENVLLMSQNERAGTWKAQPDSLLLAVRLLVMKLPFTSEDSNEIIASVVVQFDTSRNDSVDNLRSGVLDTFNIPWKWFNRAYSDTCFFSPVYGVPQNFYYDKKQSGAELSVSSRRYATFLLSAIVVTDKIADSLLSGLPLVAEIGGYDREDRTRMQISDSIVPEIILHEVNMIDGMSTVGKYCFALPNKNERITLAGMARVNQILDYRGIPETRELEKMNRIAQTKQHKGDIEFQGVLPSAFIKNK